MSNFPKSTRRWSPFKRELDFERWLAVELRDIGCDVYRQPVYMASANHIPSGKYSPKLDLWVDIPAAANSLGADLSLVVEIKNADNYSFLREAQRQAAAAMAGNDWRTAAQRGRQFRLGARPWRALVMTPGQLRTAFFRPVSADTEVDYETKLPAPWPDFSTEAQREVPRWSGDLWGLYDRQLWDNGASLLQMLAPGVFAFQVHVNGTSSIVTVKRPAVR